MIVFTSPLDGAEYKVVKYLTIPLWGPMWLIWIILKWYLIIVLSPFWLPFWLYRQHKNKVNAKNKN